VLGEGGEQLHEQLGATDAAVSEALKPALLVAAREVTPAMPRSRIPPYGATSTAVTDPLVEDTPRPPS
jgi:hypothetical protein